MRQVVLRDPRSRRYGGSRKGCSPSPSAKSSHARHSRPKLLPKSDSLLAPMVPPSRPWVASPTSPFAEHQQLRRQWKRRQARQGPAAGCIPSFKDQRSRLRTLQLSPIFTGATAMATGPCRSPRASEAPGAPASRPRARRHRGQGHRGPGCPPADGGRLDFPRADDPSTQRPVSSSTESPNKRAFIISPPPDPQR